MPTALPGLRQSQPLPVLPTLPPRVRATQPAVQPEQFAGVVLPTLAPPVPKVISPTSTQGRESPVQPAVSAPRVVSRPQAADLLPPSGLRPPAAIGPRTGEQPLIATID